MIWANNKIRFILTGACNATCPHCHNEGVSKTASYIPVPIVSLIASVARQLNQFPSNITISGGEPLLHPKLIEIIKIASSIAPTMTMPTNGFGINALTAANLADNGVTKVRIDLDPWRFNRPRDKNGNLNTLAVSEAVLALRDVGLGVAFNTVLSCYTNDQLDEVFTFCAASRIGIKCFERVSWNPSLQKFVSNPDILFSSIDASIQRSIGKTIWIQEELANGDCTTMFAETTIRYCRPLCIGSACFFSGLRCGPEGFLSTCINGLQHERLLQGDTADTAIEKIRNTNLRGCCA